jgi:hypothetical protein
VRTPARAGTYTRCWGLLLLQKSSLQREAKTSKKSAWKKGHVVGESTRPAASEKSSPPPGDDTASPDSLEQKNLFVFTLVGFFNYRCTTATTTRAARPVCCVSWGLIFDLQIPHLTRGGSPPPSSLGHNDGWTFAAFSLLNCQQATTDTTDCLRSMLLLHSVWCRTQG